MKIMGTVVDKNMKLVGLVLKGKPAEFNISGNQNWVISPFEIREAKNLIKKGDCSNFELNRAGDIIGKNNKKLSDLPMYDKNGNLVNNKIQIKSAIEDNGKLIGAVILFESTGEEKKLKLEDLVYIYGYCEPTNFILRVRDNQPYITGKGDTKKEDIPVKKIIHNNSITNTLTKPTVIEDDSNTYGCDGCGERIPEKDVYWFTSSIGFCEKCNNRLHNNLSQEEIMELYDGCESDDSDAIDTVISASQK